MIDNITNIFIKNIKLFIGVSIGIFISVILLESTYQTSINELIECYQVHKEYNIVLPKCKYYLKR